MRPRFTGDNVHHGRLASTVRSDDAAQLSRFDLQGEFVQGFEAVKADGHAIEIKGFAANAHCLKGSGLSAGIRSRSVILCFFTFLPDMRPIIPRGSRSVTRTNSP